MVLATALASAAVTAAVLALPPTVLAAASASATASSPAAASATGVPAGMQLITNDGTLSMYANLTNGNFAILDDRNGYVWQSGIPAKVAPQVSVNQYWQAKVESQFDLGWTTTGRTSRQGGVNQFNQQNPDTVSVTPITNGISLTYSMTAPYYLSFTATLVVSGNKLVATIPQNTVFESTKGQPDHANAPALPLADAGTPAGAKLGACPRFYPPPKTLSLVIFYFPHECYQITDIQFLPGFGAGLPGQSGYLVIPDGSGALVNFAASHPQYSSDFNMPVYGDPTVTPNADQWLPEANMPVFGIVHSNAQNPAKADAMLGVITQGASTANIEAVPAGQQANAYLAFPDFYYRQQYSAVGIGAAQSLKFSWKPVLGNRQVTYYFVNGSNATYAGLAETFRQYLVNHQNAKPLTAQTTPPLLLQVMAAARDVGVQFDPFNRATTFSQALQMAKDLEQAGIKSIRLSLEGWMTNGWNWTSLPKIWPPDGRLGGAAQLKNLATWSKQNSVQLVLSTNTYEAYGSYGPFNLRTDAVHQESQLPLQDFGLQSGGSGGNGYLVSPDVAAKLLFPSLLRHMQGVSVGGVDFDYLARDVYPNYQPQHVLTRSQSIQQWMGMVGSAAKTLGTAGVQGGNTYAVGSAQYFYNAPTTDSGFNYESSAVPFWEIAVHGLALYSGQEANLLSSPVQQNLQMIEDGALPNWELTWQPATVLRYTDYNILYSSQFSQWQSQLVQEYKQEQASGYAALAYVAITGNSEIQSGVNVTDYANGAEVVVNFNPTAVTLPAQYGNRVVPAQNYIVIPGGGQ